MSTPKPGTPAPRRVCVYIDGFNLYFGIRDSGLGRFLWLDLGKFASSLLKGGQELVAVRYPTSRVPGPEPKRKRQIAYLDALATLAPLVSVTYGNFQANPTECPRCHRVVTVPSEKQTDVNIAVAMLTDAFQDRFDVALLVSADSDLCPPVASIRKLFPKKTVVGCFPPGRGSKELAGVVHAKFTVGRAKLSQSQFAEEVEAAGGYIIPKPSHWDTEDYNRSRNSTS